MDILRLLRIVGTILTIVMIFFAIVSAGVLLNNDVKTIKEETIPAIRVKVEEIKADYMPRAVVNKSFENVKTQMEGMTNTFTAQMTSMTNTLESINKEVGGINKYLREK